MKDAFPAEAVSVHYVKAGGPAHAAALTEVLVDLLGQDERAGRESEVMSRPPVFTF